MLRIIILFTLFFQTIYAEEKSYIRKDTSNLEAYTYHDGKTLRIIWHLPDYIAEVDSGMNSANLRSSHSTTGRIKIKKLNKEEVNLSRENSDAYLPVFSSQNSGDGMKLVPTGKVIVFLKQGVDGYQWAAKKGFILENKLAFGNIYILNTPKKQNALLFANSLFSYPEVESAQPDFWKEAQAK